MSGNYFEVDSSVSVKSGDVVTLQYVKECLKLKITSVRRLLSGLRRCRFMLICNKDSATSHGG